jgi:hypothetical protein
MHKEYVYQEAIKFRISVSLSCLAKERCLPKVGNFKLLDASQRIDLN